MTSFGVKAQKTAPVMEFVSTTHDFGNLDESGGKCTHSFEFINKGTTPIILKDVRSSCGCTAPSWSRAPIAPGEKGFIKATFNPKNRPGSFNKSITVTANTNPKTTVLRIKGVVAKKPKTIQDSLPHIMDGLRMVSNELPLTKVKNTEIKEAVLEVYNDTDKDMKVEFKRTPKHLKITVEPEVIAPKSRAKIIVLYNAKKKDDWGFVTDYLTVLINDVHAPHNRLAISAEIVEDFGELTSEELGNAPMLEVEESAFNFGTLPEGEKAECTFILKNTGKSDLLIHKTVAACGCTTIAPKSRLIKPGKETELKVIFDSKSKRGRQNKRITIITNSPKTPRVDLRVMGNVALPKVK